MGCTTCEQAAKNTENEKLDEAKKRAKQRGLELGAQVMCVWKAKNTYGFFRYGDREYDGRTVVAYVTC